MTRNPVEVSPVEMDRMPDEISVMLKSPDSRFHVSADMHAQTKQLICFSSINISVSMGFSSPEMEDVSIFPFFSRQTSGEGKISVLSGAGILFFLPGA